MIRSLLLLSVLWGAPHPGPASVAAHTPALTPATGIYPSTPEEKERAVKAMWDQWRLDPVLFVREHFKAEPDEWQRDVLMSLLTDTRIAMSACKGPGKSTVLAWAGWWILACHPGAKGAALSITADNLKDGLWAELATWYEKSLPLQLAFEVQKRRIVSRERPDTWFLSFRSFAQGADPQKQANSLAGLHAPHVFYLLDEVGDMSPGVIAAAKGIFATKGQRGWILAAGNPTTQEGALYYVATTDAEQWRVVHVTGDPDDPKRSPRLDADVAAHEIRILGRDNPWVMVNILGLFPPVGADQLLGANAVTLAAQRAVRPEQVSGDAIIWGLDPARSDKSGADEAALARRQGLIAMPFVSWRGMDGTRLGDVIAKMLMEARDTGAHGGFPDAVFVDVGGIGTSAYDRLVHLGWKKVVRPVDFGSAATNTEKYHNKRTEMWVDMAEWIENRPSSIPDDGVLRSELVRPRYHFRVINKATKFILETKDDMRKRGLRSPNRADALALTFAAPVMPARFGGMDDTSRRQAETAIPSAAQRHRQAATSVRSRRPVNRFAARRRQPMRRAA